MRVQNLLLAALVLLAGCARNPAYVAAEAKVAIRSEALIVADGARLVCAQPSWLKCMVQSEAQCLAATGTVQEICHKEALEKSGEVVSEASSMRFMREYLGCLPVKQAQAAGKTPDELVPCLRANPGDKEISRSWAKTKLKPIFDEALREARNEVEAKRKLSAAGTEGVSSK